MLHRAPSVRSPKANFWMNFEHSGLEFTRHDGIDIYDFRHNREALNREGPTFDSSAELASLRMCRTAEHWTNRCRKHTSRAREFEKFPRRTIALATTSIGKTDWNVYRDDGIWKRVKYGLK